MLLYVCVICVQLNKQATSFIDILVLLMIKTFKGGQLVQSFSLKKKFILRAQHQGLFARNETAYLHNVKI